MEENIVNAGSEVAEEVIETMADKMDYKNLKTLGVFGAGMIAGIFTYRNVLAPAARWVKGKMKPKKVVIKVKPNTKGPEEAEDDMEDEAEE